MAKPLNYHNVKKKYLTVTLADDKKTTLLIGTPTKAVMDDIVLLQDSLDAISEEETSIELINDIYRACAKIMSRNKGGIEITNEYLENLFDLEDIIIFFNAYIDFIDEVASEKN